MTAKMVRFSFSLVALLCSASAAYSQAEIPDRRLPTASSLTGSASIRGRVVQQSGHPVTERVRITLSTLNDPGLVTYTDTNGQFGFTGLSSGTYYIEITGDSRRYEPVIEQVRLVRGMHVTLTLNLKEKEDAGRMAPGVISAAEAELEAKVPAPARQEFEKATGLVSEGKLPEAIESYKRAVEIYPEYLKARNDLGVQYLKLKRFNEAVEQFEAALEISDKVLNPRLNLGIALVEMRNYSLAIEHLNLALEIDTTSAPGHLYLGVAAVEIDQLETAKRELELALSLGGDIFSLAHYFLAHVHMKNGDRDQAVEALQAYIQKGPEGEYKARARALLNEIAAVK